MKRLEGIGGTMHTRLSRFLLAYRSTPQTTTGVTPAELLLNRRLRTRLDLIRPELRHRVETQQEAQKVHHDNTKKERHFSEGDSVLVKNFSPGLSGRRHTLKVELVHCRTQLSMKMGLLPEDLLITSLNDLPSG